MTAHAAIDVDRAPAGVLSPLERAIVNRFQHGFPRVPRPYAAIGVEVGCSEAEALAAVRSLSDGVAARRDRMPDTPAGRWLTRAVSREVASMNLSEALSDSSLLRLQQPGSRKRSWIGRHPVLFGTLAGFGAGFLIGYLPGDDGVFDDFVAEFNGLVLGGVGAGVGALVGAVATK